MLRLSKLTDYAVVVLVRLSHHDGVATSPALALSTGVPEPTVAKVLKALCASGLVASQRGARGGYRLAKPLASIPVASVITAIDGPISLTACVDGATGGCEAQGTCPIQGRWDPVNDAIRSALTNITLAQMDVSCCAKSMPDFSRRYPDVASGPAMNAAE
ncbi:SUF system Fe-S cluster assembly regulator [Lichenicola cladoniae]|uniref:SUF system Fe-S cluster assembly regulator n=1 Tax=Lichenicola cladoniae TaxID=1484109 RepID=A0A6M8HQE8_9PROT|nr:SUF system Fe-S cluster assembly regulator [Lichenicola cladoniae]NPD67946.1 SUF system Fe-S cluster assembly regulator [Acetobacteraceae bacterium]QKE90536.1 SUF system Fe-S cluster assembly regulator [Lichenicola cladoniae]